MGHWTFGRSATYRMARHTQISSDIQKDEEIFLYCRSGNRSGKATKTLLEAGYVNAKNAGSILNASELLNIKIID